MLCVFGPKETLCMGILHPPQTTSARCSLSFSTKNYSLSLLQAGDAAVNTIFHWHCNRLMKNRVKSEMQLFFPSYI